MNSWFTVKVKYTKQLENGQFKRVSEPYLVAAMTFTDAEARIYEELGSSIRGEFSVTGIVRTELHDIFAYDDADQWFKMKISYESEAGEDDKVKKVSQNFLISAHSAQDACQRLIENLSGMMVDFQITAVALSPIVEIFPFNDNYTSESSNKELETSVEHSPKGKGVIFSAPGSDLEDEELSESEFEDEYTDEE
jgi:hypothetical protein